MTSTPPIKLDGQRRLSAPIVVFLAIAGTLISTTLVWATMTNRLKDTEDLAKSNTIRITTIERRMDTDIAEIKTNLSWLKEREQTRAAGK